VVGGGSIIWSSDRHQLQNLSQWRQTVLLLMVVI
jgi:hypothetical protein